MNELKKRKRLEKLKEKKRKRHAALTLFSEPTIMTTATMEL